MLDFQEYFKEKIVNVRDLNHRGNNKLFEIVLPERSYLLKQYSNRHMDNWQRGRVEFSALSYLGARGSREIPQPISFNRENNLAIYTYESGVTLKAEEVKKENIFPVVDFLSKLHSQSNEDKISFEPASAACLSLQDYSDILDRRFTEISSVNSRNAIFKRAKKFLTNEVYPTIQKLKNDFAKTSKNLDTQLSLDSQVLTPADFGFHNILVSKGKYTFVDFEYFGRDDPARQILDFLHHDKSKDIKKELKDLFIEEYRVKAKPLEGFEERLRITDPLVGMSWVLIYLNVLSEDYLKHITFARGNIEGIVEERLKKAENKMKDIKYFKNGSRSR